MQHLIVDFDSTVVSVESLDEFAKIALGEHPKKEQIVEQIAAITKQGMEGAVPFHESLAKRFSLFSANRTHIAKLVALLKERVSHSLLRNRQLMQQHAQQIYILSGGFKEYIVPIVKEFGLDEARVFANTFVFDQTGNIVDVDWTNPLAQQDGKVRVLKQLQLTGDVIVIGDGYTDYQIKEAGEAKQFFAFTEHVRRDSVVCKADLEIKNFDELFHHIAKAKEAAGSRMEELLSKGRGVSTPNLSDSSLDPVLKDRTIAELPVQRCAKGLRALLLEDISSQAIALFEKRGYRIESLTTKLDEKELIEKMGDVSLLCIRSKTQITKKVLEASRELLAIGVFGIGVNHVDLTESVRNGVAVFNAPFSSTRSVVELVLGSMIMLSRKAFDKSMKLHQGVWDKSATNCHEVRGKKLGIVGYGNIGAQLSVLAESFGMQVYYYDLLDKLAMGNARKCSTLEELLQAVDVVTIHSDAQKANKYLIGEKEFACMKEGILFLNFSRASVVDTDALVANIKKGKVAGAAIDVFSAEPKSNKDSFTSSLQGLPNVILTPHIGGSTEEAQRNIGEFVTNKLITFVNTGDTMLSVNFPNLMLPAQADAYRVVHVHHNIPGVLAQINGIFAEHKVNIVGQYLKTNDAIGYAITDVNTALEQQVVQELKSIRGTITMRGMNERVSTI